jgi:oxaloacetate decarboxylase alpha subunit
LAATLYVSKTCKAAPDAGSDGAVSNNTVSNNKGVESYSVKVDGQVYVVEVGPQGQLTSVTSASNAVAQPTEPVSKGDAEVITAPLAGTIFKVNAFARSSRE